MKNFDLRQPVKGLGDSIAKITHTLGLNLVADKIAKVLEREDCGCERRRKHLNELVNYGTIPKKYYTFEGSRLFEILEDINIEGDEYSRGEKVMIDSNRIIYYYLNELLIKEKIKVC